MVGVVYSGSLRADRLVYSDRMKLGEAQGKLRALEEEKGVLTAEAHHAANALVHLNKTTAQVIYSLSRSLSLSLALCLSLSLFVSRQHTYMFVREKGGFI